MSLMEGTQDYEIVDGTVLLEAESSQEIREYGGMLVLQTQKQEIDEEEASTCSHERSLSQSTICDRQAMSLSSEYEELNKLSTNEKNARLIGRRVEVLIHTSPEETHWERGTILNFDASKDVHWVLPDSQRFRKEYKLSEVVFRIIETEEEWVMDVDVVDDEIF